MGAVRLFRRLAVCTAALAAIFAVVVPVPARADVCSPVFPCGTTTILVLGTNEVTWGTVVEMNAQVSSAQPAAVDGGFVVFTDVPNGSPAQIITLGAVPVTAGTAVLSMPLPRFRSNDITATYLPAPSFTGSSSAPPGGTCISPNGTCAVVVDAYAGEVIVTEFRLSGPGGAGDQYVSLYNTGAPVPLAFWQIQGNGLTAQTITTDPRVMLGTGRSYLLAGPAYALAQPPDAAISALGSRGLRLLAPDTTQTVTDEVGTTLALPGFRLGAGLPPFNPASPADQYAWTRLYSGGAPVDSRSNLRDFRLVSTTGAVVGGVQSMLGAPNPAARAFPPAEGLTQSLLDPTLAADAAPNQALSIGPGGLRLTIRRTLTNNTGQAIATGQPQLRITCVSELNGVNTCPAPDAGRLPRRPVVPHANLRIVAPSAPTSTIPTNCCGVRQVANLQPDPPNTPSAGGGLNSLLTLPTITNPIPPGGTFSFSVTLAIDNPSIFWWVGWQIQFANVGPPPAPTVPAAPGLALAGLGDQPGTATVYWTAPDDGGAAITAYNITQTPGGNVTTVSGEGTVATITGLTPGQAYTFRVSATNSVGTGPDSSPTNAVTP